MKKIFVLMFILSALIVKAQTTTVIIADTLGNSQEISKVVSVTPDVDSVTVSLYAKGSCSRNDL